PEQFSISGRFESTICEVSTNNFAPCGPFRPAQNSKCAEDSIVRRLSANTVWTFSSAHHRWQSSSASRLVKALLEAVRTAVSLRPSQSPLSMDSAQSATALTLRANTSLRAQCHGVLRCSPHCWSTVDSASFAIVCSAQALTSAAPRRLFPCCLTRTIRRLSLAKHQLLYVFRKYATVSCVNS